MRVSPLALALLLTIAAPTSLFAAPPVSPATALKQSGDDLLARRQFVEALDAYERSFAIDPNPALHYNRGRALEFLARYPEAVDAFKRFAAEARRSQRSPSSPTYPGRASCSPVGRLAVCR